jgi:hypothetical protein
MRIALAGALGLPLCLLAACAGVSGEPTMEAVAGLEDGQPARSGRRQMATADARPFYPTAPALRSFAYSRIAPDGSRVLGNLGLAVLQVEHDDGGEPRLMMLAAVHFRADAMMFSARQARAFDPDADWPDDGENYPLAVRDIEEDYGFISALPRRMQADPEALVLFWTRGMLSYIGLAQPPSGFVTRDIQVPSDDLAPLCVRGIFTHGSQPAGAFLLTFRRNQGLTGISGVLPDGTIISIVERMPFEMEDEPQEQIDEEPWEGIFTRAWL